MQTKTIIGIVLALAVIGIIGAFIYDYQLTKEQLETKKAELLAASAQIKSQNEAIESLRLDVESYKNKKPQIVEKIVTKYKEVPVVSTDATCEEKWNSLKDYIRVFYNRHGGVNYLGEKVQTTTQSEFEARKAEKIKELEAEKLQKAQETINEILRQTR